MVCDGYVKYEEAEAYRSAIMQNFRDNGKNQSKMADWRPLGFLCVRPYILFHIHGPAIKHFFSYVNITQLLKLKLAAERQFRNCLLPKGNQVID